MLRRLLTIIVCVSSIESLETGELYSSHAKIRPSTGLNLTLTYKSNPSSSINKTTTKHTDRIPGEISKKKCEKYIKASFTYNHYVSFVSGGKETNFQEFPHMAVLFYEKEANKEVWKCAGSLISENFILTAAHCISVEGVPKYVKLGITELNSRIDTLQLIAVSEVILYPEYTHTTSKYHDIGLIKLEENVHMNYHVRPACLHTEKYFPDEAIATGWGEIEYNGPISNHLLKVALNVFPAETCNVTYKNHINGLRSVLARGIVDDLMICAGSTTHRRDTCRGDSGGPLQIYKRYVGFKTIASSFVELQRDMFYILGVTSIGKPCGLTVNSPGVYTRVSAYIKWIEDIVWPESKDDEEVSFFHYFPLLRHNV